MPTATINGHRMYWEVHGSGAPLLCMGGWGTYCRENRRDAPRLIFERYQVVLFDYRGIGESGDSDVEPSTALYAADAAALLDELGLRPVHVLGMVGMGACVAQELALQRPELVRSMLMTGTWASCDTTLVDQLSMFRDVHERMGFEAFQMLCAVYSFAPDFYAANRDRILGPQGAWHDLRGRSRAHARLVTACLGHDTVGRLDRVSAPAMVLHAGADPVTGPRTTLPVQQGIPGAQGATWPELAHIIAGRADKQRFGRLLEDFLTGVESDEADSGRCGSDQRGTP